MLLREISGGGYACSVPLLLLAILGCRNRLFLLCGIEASVGLALLLDAAFHYYFAIRQLLYLLVPLVLLSGYGADWLLRQRRRWAVVVLSVIPMAAAVKDARYFTDRSDDWAPAARTLKSYLDNDYCLAMLPGATPAFHAFFEPSLNQLKCRDWKRARSVIYPVPSYTTPSELTTIANAFQHAGLVQQRADKVGNTQFSQTTRETIMTADCANRSRVALE